jgi:iron(III) transport system permease protein
MFGIGTGLLITGAVAALLYAYLVRYFVVGYQPVEAGLARITSAMDASARSLRAGPIEVFRRVHLPLIAPSVLAGGLLVFVDVMKELPATLVLRPFNFDTLVVIAYQLAADERLGEAALLSLTIVAVGVVPVILLARASARTSTTSATGSQFNDDEDQVHGLCLCRARASGRAGRRFERSLSGASHLLRRPQL